MSAFWSGRLLRSWATPATYDSHSLPGDRPCPEQTRAPDHPTGRCMNPMTRSEWARVHRKTVTAWMSRLPGRRSAARACRRCCRLTIRPFRPGDHARRCDRGRRPGGAVLTARHAHGADPEHSGQRTIHFGAASTVSCSATAKVRNPHHLGCGRHVARPGPAAGFVKARLQPASCQHSHSLKPSRVPLPRYEFTTIWQVDEPIWTALADVERGQAWRAGLVELLAAISITYRYGAGNGAVCAWATTSHQFSFEQQMSISWS